MAPRRLASPACGKQQQQLSLLVVEGFAGTYSVARHLQKAAEEGWKGTSYKLTSWAGFELKSNYAAEAPSSQQLGLEVSCYLNLGAEGTSGDATSPELQKNIIKFVRKQMQGKDGAAIDAVVVLGGPPCTMYSCAKPDCKLLPKRAAAKEAKAAWEAAQQHAAAVEQELQLLNEQHVDGPALTVKTIAGEKAAAALQDATVRKDESEAAAEQEAIQHGIDLQRSDEVVEAFLEMYKTVKAECTGAGKPCCLFMENPESNATRGLWNRDFMKQKHLKQLQNSPAGQEEAYKPIALSNSTKLGKWTPSSSAFLHCVRQTWCSYAADQPQKRTIIFTDALGPESQPTLPERCCPKHCRVQLNSKGKLLHRTIKGTAGAKKRAEWAPGYVGAALDAAVASARYYQQQKQKQKQQQTKVPKKPDVSPYKPLLPPSPTTDGTPTQKRVRSVVAAVAAAAQLHAAPKISAADAAAAKAPLGSSLTKLRKHLDYGRRHARAKEACCYQQGLLLKALQVLLGFDAKAAPLDRAIGLLKDLALGLAYNEESAVQELQSAGVASVAGLAAESKVAGLKELAQLDSKSSMQRAAAARALLLNVLGHGTGAGSF